MIFWKGKGGIVVIYVIVILLLSVMIGAVFLGYEQSSYQMVLVQILVSVALAYPLWRYGKKVNSITHEFIDKKTGKDVAHKESHTFFFIPLQYWAIIIPCLFILGYISRFY